MLKLIDFSKEGRLERKYIRRISLYLLFGNWDFGKKERKEGKGVLAKKGKQGFSFYEGRQLRGKRNSSFPFEGRIPGPDCRFPTPSLSPFQLNFTFFFLLIIIFNNSAKQLNKQNALSLFFS